MDDPSNPRTRVDPVDFRLLLEGLPPLLVAGNRYGSAAFGTGLVGLLLALGPVAHFLASLLVIAAVALGTTGFIRYARGTATNRDTAVVGLLLGWIGLLILYAEAVVTLPMPVDGYPVV